MSQVSKARTSHTVRSSHSSLAGSKTSRTQYTYASSAAPPSTRTSEGPFGPPSFAAKRAAPSRVSGSGKSGGQSIVESDGSSSRGSGDTSIHKAARNGDVAAVRELLASRPGDVDQVNDSGRTPLQVAARRGHSSVVRLLLRRGAERWQRDSTSSTALMDACEEERLGAIEALANIKHPSKDDLTQLGSTLTWAKDRRLYRSIDILIGTTRPILPQIFEAYPPACSAFRNSDPARAIPLGDGPDQSDTGNQALIDAVQKDKHRAIADLLDAGVDPSRAGPDGQTPLVIAVEHERARIVEQLLAAGADPSVKRTDGQPVLSIAAKRQNYRLIEALVRAGADVALTNRQGRTALVSLCSLNKINPGCIHALLEASNIDHSINHADERGDTAMMWAARRDDAKAIHMLLRHGAGPSVKMANIYGQTPLIEAVQSDNAHAVAELVKYKPDRMLKQRDFDGISPLEWALAKHRPRLVAILLDASGPNSLKDTNKNGDTPLLSAAKAGDADTFKSLLDYADQDALMQGDKRGDTSLIIAARNNLTSIVQDIVEKAPSTSLIEQTNAQGETALIAAAANKHLQPIQAILGVDSVSLPAGRDRNGKTALHFAAQAGNKDITEALLQAPGASDNVLLRDQAGYTPLMLALHNSHIPTAIALTEKTSKDGFVSQGSGDGSNLLHMAVIADSPEHPTADLISSLIQAGVDRFARDADRKTPLALAADMGKVGALEPLLAAEKFHKGSLDSMHSAALRSLRNLLLGLYYAAANSNKAAAQKILDAGARTWLTAAKGSAFYKAKLYVSDGNVLVQFRSEREDGALSRVKMSNFVKEHVGSL